MEDSSGLVQAVVEGTVRVRALLLAQSDEARRAIEAAIIEAMDRCRSGDTGYEVPMPAVLGSGVK